MFFNLFKKEKISLCGFQKEITIKAGTQEDYDSRDKNSLKTIYNKSHIMKEGLLLYSKKNTVDFSNIELHSFESYETTKDSKIDFILQEIETFEIESLIVNSNYTHFVIFISKYEIEIDTLPLESKNFDEFNICLKTDSLDSILGSSYEEKLIENFYYSSKDSLNLIKLGKVSKKKEICKETFPIYYDDSEFNCL